MTEAQLIRQACEGDGMAVRTLYERYAPRVYAVVRRIAGEDDLAQDYAQEAWIRAIRALPTFRGDARFSTWVYRITINLCRDHFASPAARFKQQQASLDAPGLERFDPPADGARPDEALETEEVARDFELAVRGLETKYKAAFLLRHQEGLPYDEISRVLEISVSNAKVRVHRARELILAALRERGYDV